MIYVCISHPLCLRGKRRPIQGHETAFYSGKPGEVGFSAVREKGRSRQPEQARSWEDIYIYMCIYICVYIYICIYVYIYIYTFHPVKLGSSEEQNATPL